MSDDGQKQAPVQEKQTAVPYISPPPPDESSQKKLRPPLMNGIILSVVILLGGFMTYNYVGHSLTQLESASDVRIVSPTPDISPTITLTPTRPQ